MSPPYPVSEGLQVVKGYESGLEVDSSKDGGVFPKIGEYEEFTNTQGQNAPTDTSPKTTGQKRSRKGLFLVLIIVTILVLCAVVGGTVGGIKAATKKENVPTSTSSIQPTSAASAATSATSSTTSSSTSSVANPIPTSGLLALNCPAINGTQYTTTVASSTHNFLRFCRTELTTGAFTSADLDSSLQYTFDSCINECVARNNLKKLPPCGGLTFSGNLTRFRTANCFLKTSITGTSGLQTEDLLQAAALLLD